jgi:hypothetical protein
MWGRLLSLLGIARLIRLHRRNRDVLRRAEQSAARAQATIEDYKKLQEKLGEQCSFPGP